MRKKMLLAGLAVAGALLAGQVRADTLGLDFQSGTGPWVENSGNVTASYTPGTGGDGLLSIQVTLDDGEAIAPNYMSPYTDPVMGNYYDMAFPGKIDITATVNSSGYLVAGGAGSLLVTVTPTGHDINNDLFSDTPVTVFSSNTGPTAIGSGTGVVDGMPTPELDLIYTESGTPAVFAPSGSKIGVSLFLIGGGTVAFDGSGFGTKEKVDVGAIAAVPLPNAVKGGAALMVLCGLSAMRRRREVCGL